MRDNTKGLVRFIGVMELLGALVLILPSVLRIMPILTPIAASGLELIQIFAIIFHISRGKASAKLPINLFIFILAFFVV